jgi:hypothetical protein
MALLGHEGGAEFPHPHDDVFDALLEAIPTIPGMKVQTADKHGGTISVKAGMSIVSWGESITIAVAEVSSAVTRVDVVSRPKTGLFLGGAFDLGKNTRNVERILEAVSQVLARDPGFRQASLWAETSTAAERIQALKDLGDKGPV